MIYTVTTELINISLSLLRSCLHNPRCLRPVESTVMTIFLVLSQIYPLQLLLLIKERSDDLPATEKQEKRQIRRRNSISDLTDIIPKKAPSTRKTITDKVLEALTSPDVLNKIIPILSEKICETIEATIKDIVDDKIKTHVDAHVHPSIETVNKKQQTITEQAQTLKSKQLLLLLSKQQLKTIHWL